MDKKLILRIQELFFKALEAKTSWGRNEIKDMYSGAVMHALLEHIDSQQDDLDSKSQIIS
jgi:hypothetical protein